MERGRLFTFIPEFTFMPTLATPLIFCLHYTSWCVFAAVRSILFFFSALAHRKTHKIKINKSSAVSPFIACVHVLIASCTHCESGYIELFIALLYFLVQSRPPAMCTVCTSYLPLFLLWRHLDLSDCSSGDVTRTLSKRGCVGGLFCHTFSCDV